MKQFFTISLLFISSMLLVAQPQTFKVSTPQAGGFSTERLLQLDSYLLEETSKGLIPNAVGLVAHHGKIVYYKAFGSRNIEKKIPLQKDDIFRIASQSKAITTVALMTLYEKGKFLLDDPISKYIPAFKNPQVLVSFDETTNKYTTRPAKSEITIRQLLTHTAGIPYKHPLENLPEFKMPDFHSIDSITMSTVISKLAKRPLICDPGEKFVYGMSTDVIGYLVEILSGMNLSTYIQKNITEPLGMEDTYFYLPPSKYNRLVELYSMAKASDSLTVHNNFVYRNFPVTGAKTYYSGGAGMVSTVQDYAKFVQMILNGGSFNDKQILSKKTIEVMSRNQIGDVEVWDRQDKFGLGFEIVTSRTHFGDLASPNSLTWSGMYCSEYTIDQKEDLIMIILTNVQPYIYYGDFLHRFRTLVYQALKDA